MEVKWRTEEPPVDKKTGVSRKVVVKTNYGEFNTAYWSSSRGCWYFDGIAANKECVVAWLDNLSVDE